MNQNNLSLSINQHVTQSDIIRWLNDNCYSRSETISSYGQYSVIGDVIKIFPVNYPNPFQISFYGDLIESMQKYADDQKTLVDHMNISPNIVDSDELRFEPGQYVVHVDHGIGLFKTLGLRRTDQFVENNLSHRLEYQPFLIIEYADGGELFVPPEQSGKLTHYVGARHPVLSKLGSQRWQTTKKKIEESLFKMSRELLLIAAKRQIKQRSPLKIQGDWIKLMSDQFPYDETDDQYKAIEAVLSDLSSTRIMDRLICGDAGFGKTEVAVRAAGACASAGYQVAILTPTTILARQHTATFTNRLASLPINIVELSRFVSEKDQQSAIERISSGKADIIIGTHRLLSKDVKFHNLGMLIVDEEQKFGVKHKEAIKHQRAEVDVLTLSATPIPRTLFLGLSGLRDISLIVSPPKKRLPTISKVGKTDEGIIIQALKEEKARGGQSFILHNEVETISNRVDQLRKQLPDHVIKFAHGQMPENQLANTMSEMINGKIDVLVTSTIIENGLDIPNANTLIVEKADHFGLSDLYQIRGRIGRSDKQSYAYFFYAVPELSQLARQRFTALLESDQLGSGYTIATRDLEIRGGGNVLGKEQHGNMEAVGLSLYTKMLQLVIKKMQERA
ncbi:MAG: DEAD/DEAH box helicase [Patescibacteria group bacterium]